MERLLGLLYHHFQRATLAAFPECINRQDLPSIEITPSTQEAFGHYQYNTAMKLAKVLRQPPRHIAEQIAGQLSSQHDLLARVEVAGPGFINLTLSPSFLSQQLNEMYRSSHLGIAPTSHSERVIIDFSSPNVAKEMHVGHLRSTIIGDALARVFEFLGYEVIRLNHLGDWGTAFGMLIAYMRESVPEVLTGSQQTDLTHLVQWYRASKQRFDEDPLFKQRAQREVVALQGGDHEARHAWEIICAISRSAYQEIYDLLQVQLIERGESFYNPYLSEIVSELEQKGLIQVSDGAKCLFVEGFYNRSGEPLPLMMQKSDGGYTYDTTDLAAIRHRIHEEKGDRLIYVTDAGQSTHFQMIFQAAERAGYLDRKRTRVDHVPFGLVLGSDGKKFKTRSGTTERLMDLLDSAIERADQLLAERNLALDPATRHRLARALGLGAVKYADLSNHRLSDYTFSYDRMLRFEGNTAAFLMYAYVRIIGIKRKVGIDPRTLGEDVRITLEHPTELRLGLHLLRFHDALYAVQEELLPHRLTDYLYALAEVFNAFFRDCRVEGSAHVHSRLLLCELTAQVLSTGLHLLGVETVEQM